MNKSSVSIAVVSGKGGTGKTFFSINLAWAANAVLYDCDVEEPNTQLFTKETWQIVRKVYRLVAVVNHEKCTVCGLCSRFCQFNAIVLLKDTIETFPDLCRSCGGCEIVCPSACITMKEVELGVIRHCRDDGFSAVQGVLTIGVQTVPPLIHEVMKHETDNPIRIIDSPPGTGCSAMAAASFADIILVVTEPTVFSFHDFQIICTALRSRGKPIFAALNKTSSDTNVITEFCSKENIPILVEIPFSKEIMQICAEGSILAEKKHEYRDLFSQLTKQLAAEVCSCMK